MSSWFSTCSKSQQEKKTNMQGKNPDYYCTCSEHKKQKFCVVMVEKKISDSITNNIDDIIYKSSILRADNRMQNLSSNLRSHLSMPLFFRAGNKTQNLLFNKITPHFLFFVKIHGEPHHWLTKNKRLSSYCQRPGIKQLLFTRFRSAKCQYDTAFQVSKVQHLKKSCITTGVYIF